jgi:hypothetical protein
MRHPVLDGLKSSTRARQARMTVIPFAGNRNFVHRDVSNAHRTSYSLISDVACIATTSEFVEKGVAA